MLSDEVDDWPVRWLPIMQPAAPGSPDAAAREALGRALEHPLASAPLADRLAPGMSVVIAFDAADPACPNHLIVPALMNEARNAGIADRDLTLLVAHNFRAYDPTLDMREPPAIIPQLSFGVDMARTRVIQHDPFNIEALNQMGVYAHVPLAVNFHAVEADFLVATGSVQPHVRAGLTGSTFTIGVGCAGIDAVRELFSSDMPLEDETGPSPLSAFHLAVSEAARRAGLRFGVECLGYGTSGLAIRAGEPLAVNETMAEIAAASGGQVAGDSGPRAPAPWKRVQLRPKLAVKSRLADAAGLLEDPQ